MHKEPSSCRKADVDNQPLNPGNALAAAAMLEVMSRNRTAPTAKLSNSNENTSLLAFKVSPLTFNAGPEGI